MTAAVVLAAGGSARLGESKQLVMVGGETLVDRAVRAAREAGCEPVVVVLGAEAERIRERCNLTGSVVVVNEAWEEGMASSIRVGVDAAGGADGVLLMTCDQPAVTAVHLLAVMAAGEVTASAYAGRRGVPAYFPASSFPALLALRGDVGARELLLEAATVDLVGGDLDVDTDAERDAAVKLFG